MSQKVLHEHLDYLATPRRLELFRDAVSKTVRQGDVVVDLGCGTGVLGAMCLEGGAAHCYEVDSSDALELARASFERNGLANKASFHQLSSYAFTPSDKADVIICDHVGFFGFDYDLIGVLGDARRRFLKPDGHMLPQRLELFVAAVESNDAHTHANAWAKTEIPERFHWIREYGANCKYSTELDSNDVLTNAASIALLDLRIDQPDYFSWNAKVVASRAGTIHGIAGWFNCELADDIWMTNSPLDAQRIKRPQAFFPIDRAVVVHPSETIVVNVMARPSEELIAWTVRFPEQNLVFKHSTWQGEIMGADRLRRALPTHLPTLTEAARAKHVVLGYCDGKRSIDDIRKLLRENHGDLFSSEKALERALARALAGSTR